MGEVDGQLRAREGSRTQAAYSFLVSLFLSVEIKPIVHAFRYLQGNYLMVVTVPGTMGRSSLHTHGAYSLMQKEKLNSYSKRILQSDE